ncbi:MAG TPA: aminodeoxychorismate lyase [Methylophaga sp.]|nr:aminodeoxychorismate lyase [Methylophaga sp.]
MILINGLPEDRIDARDRGLQYGDGLFETIAFRQNHLELLDAHLARLQLGCKRLKLSVTSSDICLIKTELQQITSALQNDAVIKIVLTRGVGGRGYQYAENIPLTRIISSHPMPEYPPSHQQGVDIRICEQRLAINPQLAGIKHLNRLEQVLARNEWRDSRIAEGLMLDTSARLVEGTMSNILLFKNDELFTPDLTQCGIDGVMRNLLLAYARQQDWSVYETQLTLDDLLTADECLLCNSVIGVWPIKHIIGQDRQWPHGPITQKLQQWLSQAIMHA